MAYIASVSRAQLSQRRQQLRRQRQMRVLQTVWRTVAVSSLTGGLFWLTLQPIWVVSAPRQIEISGNNLLSEAGIQSLLKVTYPKSLLRIEPSAIALALQKQSPIAEATVTRRLFPPGLVVQVKERMPVAIAQAPVPRQQPGTTSKASVGLIDEKGMWIPMETYTKLAAPNLKLPSLKVLGTPEQYRPYWQQIYQALSNTSIKVTEINCQDPTNLIFKTELGTVHLGSNISLLPEQLRVLGQMRQLPAQLKSGQLEYIDLKNPESPLVQMNQLQNQKNTGN